MHCFTRTFVIAMAALGATAWAQTPSPPPSAAAPVVPAGQDAAASLLKLYVFPANSQTPDQQAADSNQCYGWARQETGVDPAKPNVPAKPDTSQAGQGVAVRGAGRGAAAGAAIGAIAGHPGKGAAIGATAGGVEGIGARRAAQQQAAARATQQQQQAANDQLAGFKNAYTACMEGKKYGVK